MSLKNTIIFLFGGFPLTTGNLIANENTFLGALDRKTTTIIFKEAIDIDRDVEQQDFVNGQTINHVLAQRVDHCSISYSSAKSFDRTIAGGPAVHYLSAVDVPHSGGFWDTDCANLKVRDAVTIAKIECCNRRSQRWPTIQDFLNHFQGKITIQTDQPVEPRVLVAP